MKQEFKREITNGKFTGEIVVRLNVDYGGDYSCLGMTFERDSNLLDEVTAFYDGEIIYYGGRTKSKADLISKINVCIDKLYKYLDALLIDSKSPKDITKILLDYMEFKEVKL